MSATTSKAKQCLCGQWHTSRSENCPDCQKSVRGMNKTPLYKTWSVHYRAGWPDFLDFYREVGHHPGIGYRLAGKTPGTSPAQGTHSGYPKTP